MDLYSSQITNTFGGVNKQTFILKTTNVMSEMENNIFFQPFVGKHYADGGMFGKRIMILGESHYCDEGCTDCGDCRLHRECMGFTQNVLADYLDETNGMTGCVRS